MHEARALMIGALLSLVGAPLGAQTVDTAAAIRALTDYTTACRRDAGRLWGRSLCGALILVDPASRASVANELPPGGAFESRSGVYSGRLPPGIPVANTSLMWAGKPWAFVLLPLAGDRFSQASLLIHESFHRIQDTLGLGGPDLLNTHLDERDGRYWFRLELRALARALRGSGSAARRAAADALLFRARRHALFPGADSLERALELQEGLAEYTGVRLAMDVTGAGARAGARRAAKALDDFHSRSTYVRSAGYATGPALGLLLDRYAPGWRTHVRERGLAPQLALGLRFTPPRGLAAAATRRATAYAGNELAVAEDRREVERSTVLARYRARLIDGPVVTFRQEGLQRSFNPNNLIAFGENGTIYPTGTFGAPWGTLDITGGALVSPDFGMVRVAAPADPSARPLRGEGWTLELAPGWELRPGKRSGDYDVVKAQ